MHTVFLKTRVTGAACERQPNSIAKAVAALIPQGVTVAAQPNGVVITLRASDGTVVATLLSEQQVIEFATNLGFATNDFRTGNIEMETVQ